MTKVNAARKAHGLRPQEPWQLFDLIGGTSTGGCVTVPFPLAVAPSVLIF